MSPSQTTERGRERERLRPEIKSLVRWREIAPGSTPDVASCRDATRHDAVSSRSDGQIKTAGREGSLASPILPLIFFSSLASVNIFRSDSSGDERIRATCRSPSAAPVLVVNVLRFLLLHLFPSSPRPPCDVPLTVTISSTCSRRHLASKHVWPLALSRKGLPLSRYSC